MTREETIKAAKKYLAEGDARDAKQADDYFGEQGMEDQLLGPLTDFMGGAALKGMSRASKTAKAKQSYDKIQKKVKTGKESKGLDRAPSTKSTKTTTPSKTSKPQTDAEMNVNDAKSTVKREDFKAQAKANNRKKLNAAKAKRELNARMQKATTPLIKSKSNQATKQTQSLKNEVAKEKSTVKQFKKTQDEIDKFGGTETTSQHVREKMADAMPKKSEGKILDSIEFDKKWEADFDKEFPAHKGKSFQEKLKESAKARGTYRADNAPTDASRAKLAKDNKRTTILRKKFGNRSDITTDNVRNRDGSSAGGKKLQKGNDLMKKLLNK